MRSRMLTAALRARPVVQRTSAVSTPSRLSAARWAHSHSEESFESFSERYVSFFQSVQDLFELQRGLNNCFAHDLVPAPTVIEAALRAARRVDDYSTAVRILEGVKAKVENKTQYDAYLSELKGTKDDLGVCDLLFLLNLYWSRRINMS